MDFINSDEEFNLYFDRLNTITSKYRLWSPTKARKHHVDEYGVEIEEGEIYYKREAGAGWGSSIKLAKKSMITFLFTLFYGNRGLVDIIDMLIAKDQKDMCKAINKLSKSFKFD